MKKTIYVFALLLLILYYSNIYSQCITGDCNNGEGTYLYSNAKYWGNWKDGKREGKGIMYFNDGSSMYKGNWSNDKKNGFGILYWSTGDRYEGNWVDNIRTGQGTLYLKNGDRFVGQFLNDQTTENGVTTIKAIPKLCISGDCNNGFGKFGFTNAVYEGYFKNGKREGKGKTIGWDGGTYEGDYVNDLKNGKGKHTYIDGDVYDGDWINGEQTGKGIYIWGKGKWEGETYDGDWINGKRTGYGKYTKKDGTVQEGKFLNNVFQGVELAFSNTQVNTQEKNCDQVKIGSCYWQNQNCSITKYINGDPIFYAKNSQQLEEANNREEGAYCFVNFDDKLGSNFILYNWFAIMDPRGFGTSDLRVPQWEDWKNLIYTLEKDLKTWHDLKNTEDWVKINNKTISNYYGFNAIPTYYGFLDPYHNESFKKSNGIYFWIPNDFVKSAFIKKEWEAYQFFFSNQEFSFNYFESNKTNMAPVRLIKGVVSYFDGKVVAGQKQGQGKLYVRNDRYDFVNEINVQTGSIIEGNWTDNNLQGRAKITWLDGTSEDALFSKNLHQGALRIDQNKTQKCLYDGKPFSSHYKKTLAEIEAEKSSTKSVVIRAYKTELYCNSTCEAKAEEERLERQKESQSTKIAIGQPNAFQCRRCLYLSMGTSEPGAFAFGGCGDDNPRTNGKSDHSWTEVSTTCEHLQSRNTTMYKPSSCLLQCRHCGAKSYMMSVTAPFGGRCPNDSNHDWKEY